MENEHLVTNKTSFLNDLGRSQTMNERNEKELNAFIPNLQHTRTRTEITIFSKSTSGINVKIEWSLLLYWEGNTVY